MIGNVNERMRSDSSLQDRESEESASEPCELRVSGDKGTAGNKRYAQPGMVLMDHSGVSELVMPELDASNMPPSVTNEHTQMSLLELGRKYKRKNDLYRALRFKAQVYLPNEYYCPYEFMKDILTGKKKYFFNHGIYRQQVESFPEFTVKRLVQMVKDNEDVMRYLPDVNLSNPRQV